MPKRGKSERRDPEKGPKSPVMNQNGRIRTPEVAKRRGALMVKNEYDSNYSISTKKM